MSAWMQQDRCAQEYNKAYMCKLEDKLWSACNLLTYSRLCTSKVTALHKVLDCKGCFQKIGDYTFLAVNDRAETELPLRGLLQKTEGNLP